jgi:hypothetical protein
MLRGVYQRCVLRLLVANSQFSAFSSFDFHILVSLVCSHMTTDQQVGSREDLPPSFLLHDVARPGFRQVVPD